MLDAARRRAQRSATAARCIRGARSTARRPRRGTRRAPRSTTSTPTSPTRCTSTTASPATSGSCSTRAPRCSSRRRGFWMRLGFFSERRDGRFCIHGVTGPDEYTTVVDNNAYTNLMAKENLEVATRVVEWLQGADPAAARGLVRATGLTGAEVDELAPRGRAHVRPARRALGIVLQDEQLPRAQALGLRAHAAGEAPAAAALPPARALPPPGDQADRRRAGHLPRRRTTSRRREAAHVRLLRPAHDRRLDPVGLRPERHGLRGRLRGRGLRLLPRRLRRRPARPRTATPPTASTSPPAAAPGWRSSPASAACATPTATCASARACRPTGSACASASRSAAS